MSVSIGRATDAVVDTVVDEHPELGRLAKAVIVDQIRNDLSWTYGTPRRESADLYSVRATAGADIKIAVPFLDERAYSMSAPFDLKVNAETRSVTNWSVDLLSVKVRER